MQTQFQNVEAVSTINYQFTAIPTHFIYLMDNDCFKLFAILIQKESYWKNKNMLKDGYFIKSITELGEEMNIKNRKDIRLIIEALYRKDLISIQVQPQKHNTAKFKLNWNVINEYLDKPIYDVIEFEEKISKLNRNEDITYINSTKCTTTLVTTLVKSDNNVTNDGTNMGTELGTECTTTKDNINNINKKNNIYNNIKKNNINIYNNILEENSEEIEVVETSISDNNKEIENYEIIEEVGFINYPTSEKEEINPMTNGNGSDDEDEVLDMIFGEEIIEDNNNTFQLCEVGMLETKENNMNTSFEKNFNDLLARLGDNCSSVEELEQKTIKLCGWVIKHQMDYNDEERQTIHNLIADKYDELKEIIESNIKAVNKAQDEFFNNINLDPTKAKTVNQVKKENESVEQPKEITKEKIEKDINDFINSLPTYEDYSRATDTANYITNKFDKLIRKYGLMQLAMDMYTQIDAQKNANKSDLTNFNNQDVETITNDEKTQEIASCEVVDECTNIEDCIASLIEDLEPAVLDKEEILF